MQDFQGRTAVLTGAGSGLGLACARVAAARGMRLVLADVQDDALAAAATELQDAGAELLALRTDVADPLQMQALADAARERFGVPHLVFNNAGVGVGGLVWENSLRDWEWVLGVNLWGVVHGVRLFTPMMLAEAARDPAYRGHIVNTASMAGLVNTPNMGVYNVSKHAVVALSETLHHDLALVTGQVRASVLCPYFVPTGIAHSQRNRPVGGEGEAASTSQQVAAAMLDKAVQSGRVGAADVAQQVFDAVAQGRFYIYSHPQALAGVQTRLEDVVQARNPTDPFAQRPELGARLRASLRAG